MERFEFNWKPVQPGQQLPPQQAQAQAALERIIPTLWHDIKAFENDRTPYKPNDPAVKLYDDTKDAVVRIRTNGIGRDGKEHSALGSGFFIDTDGKLATAFHVVDKDGAIQVELTDGRVRQAHIVDVKPLSDIAILQVDKQFGETFKALQLADTARGIEKGAPVYVIGHPQGWDDVFLSPGKFNGRESTTDAGVKAITNSPNQTLLHADIHVEHGNSGGPMLNAEGKVVGILSFGNDGKDGYSDTVDDLKSLLGTTKTSDYFPKSLYFGDTTLGYGGLTGAVALSHFAPRMISSPRWGNYAGAVGMGLGAGQAINDLTQRDFRSFTTAWNGGTTAEKFNASWNMGADISMLAGTAFYIFGGSKLRTAASIMMGSGTTAKFINSLLGDRTY